MKKNLIRALLICGLVLITCFLLTSCGAADPGAENNEVIETVSSTPDPEAENYEVTGGVITKYTGPGGEITIPATINGETITAIGEEAFYDNHTVTGVTISEGIKEIGASAFQYSDVKKLNLGSVEKIGEAAFRFAPLDGVTIPDTVTELGFQCFASLTHTEQGNGKLYIPATLKAIPEEAFIFTRFDSIEFESATLPELAANSFENAGVVDIILPDSVTMEQIPEYTAKLVASGMYESNISLWNNKGEELVVVYEDFSDRFRYNDSEGWLIEYIGNDKTVVLPTEINGNPITVIMGSLFADNTEVEKVIIPKGYTEIGSYAFECCTNLKSVIVEDGLEIIGEGAFFECPNLESFVIPDSVTKMGSGVFSRCEGLKNVVLNSTMTEIPENTFLGCDSLESIDIPDNIKSIGLDAFNRSGLTSIDLNKVETLGEGCLSRTMLTEVTVPGTVKVIPDSCFGGCTQLADITLENGVERIEEEAFINCGRDESKKISNSIYYVIDPSEDSRILPNQEDYQYNISISLPGSLKYVGPDFVTNCFISQVYMLDVKSVDEMPEFDINAFATMGALGQVFFEKDVIDAHGEELDQFLVGLNGMEAVAWYDDGRRAYWAE